LGGAQWSEAAEELVSETHPVVAAVDRDDAQPVADWIKAGHSPWAKLSTRTHERLLERALVRGSERVLGVLLESFKKEKGHPSLSDSRGTPIILSLSSLAIPGKQLTLVYERMIIQLIRVFPDLLNERDRAYVGEGRLPIHGVAAAGNLSLAQEFLKAGADVNAKNSMGETPLHLAARFGHLEVVRLLVSKGAMVNEQTRFTKATPLMFAAEMGHESTIRYLMISGAIKNVQDAFGKTAPDRFREFTSNSEGSERVKR
jgi:hypothetical protein